MLPGMKRATSKDKERLWRGRVRAWKASGESAVRFAGREGFAASSLLYWRRRFEEASKPVTSTQPASKPAFACIVPRSARPKDGVTSTGVELEIAGVAVRVTRGFDPALLSEVVRALRGGGAA